jgi:SAM-dependent methyltransferase
MTIHTAAAAGFSAGVAEYEAGRPDYSPAALDWLAEELPLRPGLRCLDLAAGTGKFTALLAATGAELLAVEPVAAMRAKLSEKLPAVRSLDGAAEAIPLTDHSLDALTAAQAFHWFDAPRAAAEIARVLKPGGGLALLWNRRDETRDWVRRLTGLIDPHQGDAPRYKSSRWRDAFTAHPAFTEFTAREFPHAQRGPREAIVARVLSISFIAQVRAQVEQLLAEHPETRDETIITLPYQCDVFVCHRR